MQKVTFEVKRVTGYDAKAGKVIVSNEKITTVVASTKSQRKYRDDLQATDGVTVNDKATKVETFFLDREKTVKAITDSVKTQITDKEIIDSVIEHVIGVLKNGCLFEQEKATDADAE